MHTAVADALPSYCAAVVMKLDPQWSTYAKPGNWEWKVNICHLSFTTMSRSSYLPAWSVRLSNRDLQSMNYQVIYVPNSLSNLWLNCALQDSSTIMVLEHKRT